MRICIYHNLASGGGKRALYEMTRRLAKSHEVDVYTLSVGEHEFCDLRPHCRAHVIYPFRPMRLAWRPFGRLNQGIRSVDLLRLQALQRRIAARIDDGGYDAVLAHNCQYGQSPAVLQFLQSPSIYYCAEPPRVLYEPPVPRPSRPLSPAQRAGNWLDPLPGLYRATLRRLDTANVRSASMVLVNSHYSRETLYRTYGIFAHVGRLGVDTERFRPLPLAKEQRVVSVGALTPRKGFELVIRSLGQIEETQRPSLTIISNYAEPLEHHYLQGLAKSLGVQVKFRMGVTDNELIDVYNRSLLTIYAPIMEPFGLVPLESMACGTPVVGVQEAGVRETIRHEETGLLVERDPVIFAEATVGLLADPQRLACLGRQGREDVLAHWSWERSVRALEDYVVLAKQGTQ